MRRFSVTIEKTVQVKQFEPVKVILTTELEGTTEDRDEAYAELKQKMNEIFGKPSSCLD